MLMCCMWLVGRLDMRLVGLCQLREGHTTCWVHWLASLLSAYCFNPMLPVLFVHRRFFHANMFRALLLDCGADQLFGLMARSMRHVSRLDDPDSIVQFCLLRSLTHEVLACLATDRLHILTVLRIPWTVGQGLICL